MLAQGQLLLTIGRGVVAGDELRNEGAGQSNSHQEEHTVMIFTSNSNTLASTLVAMKSI